MMAWLQHHRRTVLVFSVATLWFLPGLWWGLPVNNVTGRMSAWGTDEIGPWGAVDAILLIVGYPRNEITPQYPLAQFLVQAIFVWPYYLPHLFPSIVDKLGLPQQQLSVGVLMLLHRLPSLLMAAGTVAAAFVAACRLAGNAAGWVAAGAVATTGPMLYYARTSNVDVAALFWTALAIVFAVNALREGLTPRRAIAIGLCAGIGTATKDQQYAFFFGLGLVVVTAALLDRRRSADWSGWWRGPALGLGAAVVAYLVLSGIALLPHWFFDKHVRYITRVPDPNIPQPVLALAAVYHSTPATFDGYLELARNAGSQMLAAVGLPIFVLALAGAAWVARTSRRLFALLTVPSLCLALGVLVPVRLVLPRYLLPMDFVLCLFAGLAIAATASKPGVLRAGAIGVAVAGIAWGGLRGADLTYQMLHDSRYEAGDWLARNVAPGDDVAYFGVPFKLPRLPAGTVAVAAPGQWTYAYKNRKPATSPPAFLVSIPQLITEPDHEVSILDSTIQGLNDGSLGYQEVLAIQTPALWTRPMLVASPVNPPVRIFARSDVVPRLRDSPRIELPALH